MTPKQIREYIDKKIEKNNKFVRITFYEVMIELNIKKSEEEDFLKIAKGKLELEGYDVYFTGSSYNYNEKIKEVETNKLIIALK